MTEAVHTHRRAIVDAIVPPTKLDPPPVRPEHVSRPALVSRLSPEALPALAVVAAPAGYGKSTLLAEVARGAPRGTVGWLSLDRDDADPARFWFAFASALHKTRPESFPGLGELARRGVDPSATLVPTIVSDAATLPRPLVLVLDDYHRLGRSDVHEQLSRLIELAPPHLRIVVSTRADPSLPLARLRAAGELVEVRVSDLRFSDAEAATFLNDNLALALSPDELGVLVQRAEGWASALYLAALSIAQREDRRSFIEGFAGTSRFVVDYLGDEVLGGLPAEEQGFLLRCSVLTNLTGPLVDHVLERSGSASVLHELERSNLLVVPLDDSRTWYRLHHLFADLLRSELHEREPELVPGLHARASRWFAENGFVDDAIQHALSSGDTELASRLIAESFWPFAQRGQVATVHRWLEELPEAVVTSDPCLCVVAAWASMFRGRPAEVEGWLALAESADGNSLPMPGGLGTVGAAVSLVRAGFAAGDVGGQVRAGRRAVERTYETEMWGWIADGCLGIALFWAGELDEARMRLERVVGPLEVADLPQAAALGRAYLALVDLERRHDPNAREQLDHALGLVRAHHLDEESDTGVVYLARGSLAARGGEGDLVGAQVDLERAVALTNQGSNVFEQALARVELAYVLELLDMRERAQPLLEEVSAQLAGFGDPGMLGEKLARTRERLGMVEAPSGALDSELTDRELEVLAYLPGPLSQREIGAALWVSFNTVTSHIRSIYRKLGVSSRREAVERAREIDLL